MLAFDQVRFSRGRFRLQADVALRGPITAMVGSSGAGKTTFLELSAGLLRPDAGSIRFGDACFADIGAGRWLPPRRRGIGYLPQDIALFPHLTVGGNLRFGASRPDSPFWTRVVRTLELSGLESRSVQSLSGGERQRVALGRALLAGARLLLLDEPLSSLDAPLKARLLIFLARVRDEFGTPMVYVTHDATEARALANEVVRLEGGAASPPSPVGDGAA